MLGGSTVRYTPTGDLNGADSFTYQVDDGNGATATALVSVDVRPVNDAPVAIDDAALTSEDTAVDVDVLANDTDVDGDVLQVSNVVVTVGSVSAGDGNTLRYAPPANFSGEASFTYEVADGNGASDTATVTVTVAAVNDAPVAVDDTSTTNEDTPVNVNVLGNDSDAEGEELTVTQVGTPSNGTATIISGQVSYVPDANFHGSDSFTYTISDPSAATSQAQVDITVTPVNDAPDAVDDAATTNEDTPVVVNVAPNDTDIDGDVLSVSANSTPAHGTVSFSGNEATYTPAANYTGADSFTYTVSDTSGATDTATVNVTVTPVNDAPVAVGDSFSTPVDSTLVVSAPGVLVNDSDVDGDAITAQLVAGATNGSVALAANGSFSYAPNAAFTGTDSFTYRASDGTLTSNTVTVRIAVQSGGGGGGGGGGGFTFSDRPLEITDLDTLDVDVASGRYTLGEVAGGVYVPDVGAIGTEDLGGGLIIEIVPYYDD